MLCVYRYLSFLYLARSTKLWNYQKFSLEKSNSFLTKYMYPHHWSMTNAGRTPCSFGLHFIKFVSFSIYVSQRYLVVTFFRWYHTITHNLKLINSHIVAQKYIKLLPGKMSNAIRLIEYNRIQLTITLH